MTYTETLIDKGRKMWGSDAKVAQRIGLTRQAISAITKGKMKLSPESAALLAAELGEDAATAVQRVMMENAPAALSARLQQAFRVAAGAVGVVVLAALGNAPSPANAGTIKTDREFVRCQSFVDTTHIVAVFRWLALMARSTRRSLAEAFTRAQDRCILASLRCPA